MIGRIACLFGYHDWRSETAPSAVNAYTERCACLRCRARLLYHHMTRTAIFLRRDA